MEGLILLIGFPNNKYRPNTKNYLRCLLMGGTFSIRGKGLCGQPWQQVASLTHSCCTCAATMTQSWTKGKLKEQSTWICRERCQELAMVPTSFPADVFTLQNDVSLMGILRSWILIIHDNPLKNPRHKR